MRPDHHGEFHASSPEPGRIRDVETNWHGAGKNAGRKSKRETSGSAWICRGSSRASGIDRRWHDCELRWANELSLDSGFVESDRTELFVPSAGLGRMRSIAGIGRLRRNLLILELVRAHLGFVGQPA